MPARRRVRAPVNNTARPGQLTLPGVPDTVDTAQVIGEMVRRASSMGYEAWWRRAESVGFCAHPIQLVGADEYGRARVVWTRCNNRRAHICPSCSDLYARDTWQLVHAGAAGGHHDMPTAVADRPQVFLTLTAPSFGAVHTAPRQVSDKKAACRDHHRVGGYRRCPHGKPLWCSATHDHGDDMVGQPLCAECYDYVGHVLFTWHLPELWRRFTITLRRTLRKELKATGVDPDGVRVSFIKIIELQARAIPHIHALIRLDPHDEPDETDWESPVSATALATIIQHAARTVTLAVDDPGADGAVRVIAFGTQIDTQPVTAPNESMNCASAQNDSPQGMPLSGRRVARYLAKYVTKSLAELGISARRLSAEAIPDLNVSEHVRAILTTISHLADNGLSGIGRWLHTLGFRGHITSKSRRYSTTMTALRERRATWTREQLSKNSAYQYDPFHRGDVADELVAWEFERAGHASLGDRTLTITAALRHIHERRTAREALQQQRPDVGIEVPDG
ncbi:plasmid replication initiator protein [Mycobacterium avium]|uniref:replication initiator n=2 Tax=Mycobacterium avium TaxID=1764 RepID=UPI000BAF36B6|nr:plasmid replication initiator protein [Mycobacterium avium]PBA89813.1 plasmid replication initiator protein [Mycobacterium avium]PBJ47282.1 plasmid replication initiator protein [Mycobacterium avium subsp. hominissuis]